MDYYNNLFLIKKQLYKDIYKIKRKKNKTLQDKSKLKDNYYKLKIIKKELYDFALTIVDELEINFHKLDWLNIQLEQFKLPLEENITQAIKSLKKVNINIYDFYYKLYNKQFDEFSYDEFKKDISLRSFPLKLAKKYPLFKLYLRH
jgi:hypothetical protein